MKNIGQKIKNSASSSISEDTLLNNDFISTRGEILEQIQLVNSLISVEKNQDHLNSLYAYQNLMFDCFDLSLMFFSSIPNVDPTKSDKVRFDAMWKIICYVVDDMDSKKTPEERKTIKKFFMKLMWHESGGLKRRKQDLKKIGDGLGPARGFPQFQANRAKTACEYAQKKGWVNKLAVACGKKESEIKEACQKLGAKKASFPKDNIIEECLLSSDLFAVTLMRIDFKRFKGTIPKTDEKMCEYWFKYWNRGDKSTKEAKKKRFKENCATIKDFFPN